MVKTFREKFIEKYKLDSEGSYNVADVAKITGFKKSVLQAAFNRGVGASKTNPSSVRAKTGEKKTGGVPVAKRMSAEQWGYGRLFGLVMGNPKQIGEGKPDHDLYMKMIR